MASCEVNCQSECEMDTAADASAGGGGAQGSVSNPYPYTNTRPISGMGTGTDMTVLPIHTRRRLLSYPCRTHPTFSSSYQSTRLHDFFARIRNPGGAVHAASIISIILLPRRRAPLLRSDPAIG